MPQAAIPMIVMAAMTAASTMYQASEAKESAHDAQKKNEAMARQTAEANRKAWEDMSKPNEAAVEASATQNRGALAQSRLGAYQSLANQMASRGFGSGSGIMAKGAGDIESSYLKALGNQQTELTKFANTPMFGAPSSAYQSNVFQQPVSGAVSSGLSGLDTAMGYYMMNNLLKNNTGSIGRS